MAGPGAAPAVAQVATGPTPKFVHVAAGPRLEYVEQGDRAGIPVILLHGYTDSWRSYERVLPFLPKRFHVFAVSQRGHGNSDRPLDGYRAQDFARDVAGFLDAVHVKSAVVVGHSMGARNAMRFAIDYPQRTRALVLVGAFMPGRPNAAVQEFWDTSVSGLTDPIDPAFARAFQQDTLAQRVPREFFDSVVAESLKVPARVWKAALSGFMSADFAADLPKITAPTLLVWGAKDSFAPQADQDALVSAIKGAKVITYPSAGHGVHWEEPERFAADLANFSRRAAGTGGPRAADRIRVRSARGQE
jgi:pimeloyl-ACP methyl ester carboxylesterase